MTSRLRVVDTGEAAGRWNVAATAALTERHQRGEIGDTLRFHRYSACVLVGRHQIVDQAVRSEACRADGIEIARRLTGGGAVYMAQGALAWDIVLGRRRLGSGAPHASRRIGAALARGIESLGVAARYRAESDIEIDGLKVCGMSGYRDGDTFVSQGTILVDTDLRDMARYLRLPAPPEMAERALPARVTTMSAVLGGPVSRGRIETAIAAALAAAFGCELVHETPGDADRETAEVLHRDEYGTDAFVFGPCVSRRSRSLSGRQGNAEIFVRLHAGTERRIDQVWITGGFATLPPRAIADLEAVLRDTPMRDAPRKAVAFLSDREVELRGVSADCIAGAIANADTMQEPRS